MNQPEIIIATAAGIQSRFSGESTGHDWWHVYRVWQMAKQIGKEEGADLFVVEMAALLHDIADWKFHDGDDTAGPREARAWMQRLGVEERVIAHVCDIIRDLSFKGAAVITTMKTKEGMVVQDADRLDALGAIGIARAFAYGGHKGRELHNPEIPPALHATFEQYKNSTGTTLNHFHEKLLLLKDRMHTQTAKRIAGERHAYMEDFVKRFKLEWGSVSRDMDPPAPGPEIQPKSLT